MQTMITLSITVRRVEDIQATIDYQIRRAPAQPTQIVVTIDPKAKRASRMS